MPLDSMEVVKASDFVLMYLTWLRLFPSGAMYIPNRYIDSSAFRYCRGAVMPYLDSAVKVFLMPGFVHLHFI